LKSEIDNDTSGGAAMASIVRWDPFREMMSLRDVMDRLVDDAYIRPRDGMGMLFSPAIDVIENEDEVVIHATLPGVKPSDVNLTVTGDVLTIRGEAKSERDEERDNYIVRERRFGSFSRSIPLPTAVVADKAKAEFDNGVLTLSLPKADEVKPKTISIKAK
jgi:HSP20 family protein